MKALQILVVVTCQWLLNLTVTSALNPAVILTLDHSPSPR